MSQNDFTLANQSFPAFRADLNSALQALASNSSGGSAPSTTFANMWWYDTSNNIMYIRNEDNDAWIKFAELDQTNDKFVLSGTLQLDDGTVSAPALTFNSDTNMGIYRGGTDILKFVTAGTDAITIDASQGVTLAGKLDVSSGTIKLDGNYPVGTNNVALGDQALNGSTTGSSNVAVGMQALVSNTDGVQNVAVGRRALYLNTSGDDNIAIGAIALDANISGQRNVGISSGSLGSNTTGANNTAVGYLTLNNNNTADNNTAVGYQALQDNTTGTANTALGKDALANNITASNNTAVGFEALIDNISGTRLTAIGHRSLATNTTGVDNVAVGCIDALAEGTLQDNTTGANNVAVGGGALHANSTGSNNSALGYRALKASTTAQYNVAIGRSALTAVNASFNTAVGYFSGGGLISGTNNVFVGKDSGYLITTGSKNTILGSYSGNQSGLDIRTDSNRIVLSDGDGIPAVTWDGSNNIWEFNKYVAVSDGNFHSRFGGGQASNNNACGFVFLSCGLDDDRTGLYWEQAGVINTRMWIDDTGDLRVFSGNPTSDTGGTVVGTQTFTGTHIYKTDETDLIIGEAVCLVGQKIARVTNAKSKICVGIYAGQSWKIQDSMGNACNDEDGWGHAVIAIGDTRFHQSDFETVGVLVDGAVTAGDLLCTSSTAGKLTVQDDDIIHSYTVGKAMESGDGSSPIYAYIYSG